MATRNPERKSPAKEGQEDKVKMPPEYHAAYYQANKDKLKARMRARYQANKEAANKDSKRWAAEHPERRREISKKSYSTRPFLVHSRGLDRLFGWEHGTHERLLREAKECALCGRPLTENRYGANSKVTDHDHATGKFRGIIHLKCNAALGMFADSEDICLRAAAYLRGHRESK